MLADDLSRGIAFDPRRAVVPGHHVALRIEHEGGVILDGADKQFEHLRRRPGAFLEVGPTADVPVHLR
ncbi:MAG TPA: hypothetical protein VG015_01835 [Candidatus Dormibacteraeota bacterium]|jgi:hypothetical protein|nr:hypothetical protein [Candidatus Dormibacteraeota bacterium]